jgi:hypothetical protein
MKRAILALLALPFLALPALAGSGTITITPGTGATYQTITNGATNNVGMFGVCDGTAAAQCAAVKPASTAALAADPSLVVGLSPNSLLPAFAATPTVNLGTIGGAATAANQASAAATQASVIGTLAAGASATNSLLVGGVFNTVAPTLTNGQQVARQVDASGNALVNVKTGTLIVTQASGSNLHTVCDSGCIAATLPDENAFTFGSSTVAIFGGVFQTTPTSNPLGNGQTGAIQVTSFRAEHVNLRNLAGTEIGTAATPLQVTGANGTFPNTAAQTPVAPATATATAGVLNGAQFNTTQPTFTNGQQGALLVSSRGELLVTTGIDPIAVGGQAANASVPVGNPVLVAGFDGTNVRYISTTATGAVNITGSITASSSPYLPVSANTATLAVTSVSARVAIPAGAPTTIVVYNTGANNAFVALGSAAVVATTTNDVVGAGCWLGFATGANVDVAAITASSTTTLVITSGAGLPSGGCSPIFSGTIATVNQGTPPWSMNLTQVNGVALGSPSSYGTSPGVVTVAGVNAFVTNTIAGNITQIAGSSIAVAATGIIKVGLTDGTGNALVSSSGALEVAQIASIPTSVSLQSAAVANGNGTLLATNGMSGAVLTVNCSACSGGTTVNFEGTEDNANFTPLLAYQLGTTTFGTSTTAAGVAVWRLAIANLQNIRARISTYSAGTVTVTGHTTPVADSITTLQANSNTSLIGGSAVSTAASGVQKVGVVGNAGATLDSTVVVGTAPTNQIVVGAIFNSTEITPTTGQAFATQADAHGRIRHVIMDGAGNTRAANVNASSQLSVSIDGSSSIVGTNIAQVNAVTVLTGAGAVGTGSARIALGQDTTTIAGSAPGTAGTASANVVTVQGVASMTPLLVNPGTPATIGVAATGATVPANAQYIGCQAINAEITAVTNGQLVSCVADLVGKIITSPHANKENFLTGSTAAVTTATNTSVIAAQAAGIKIYMTGFSCANTGATASLIQFTSGSGGTVLWTTINPAGSGTNGIIDPPVATATATALFVTTGSASTSQFCSVTGYKGT